MSIASADDVQLDTQLYTMIELEANRYRAFFAKLSVNECSISRDVALEFFRKSKLSEEQVQELYSRLKGLRLLQERERVNETEFVMGMHFIVCMTKRNLVKIPPTFPSYLFPSLDLTSEFPSSDPFDSSTAPLGPNPPISIITTSTMTLGTPLSDAQSLSDLVTTELRNKQHEVEVLSRVQHSEMRALQSLHACVERIADQVDRLGFPVPNSSRSLEVLDDLRNLLQKHILAAKQEIQSIQIDAQMRSVASEVAQESGPREDPLNVSCSLTQELIALQHQTSQLMTKKTDVIERLVAVKTGGSAAGTIEWLDIYWRS
ncbi:hypothetical protein PHMEG_00021814 [Phytophthora megakarya]|uniref:EH domain-containing protein n=1 Tax=Phytophthora megakarya TaxID=4795 RepID=A0A225VKX5_9STRA|nr:hypothetical protein PHMEG_00021814 [Phytophthora megakarya]